MDDSDHGNASLRSFQLAVFLGIGEFVEGGMRPACGHGARIIGFASSTFGDELSGIDAEEAANISADAERRISGITADAAEGRDDLAGKTARYLLDRPARDQPA